MARLKQVSDTPGSAPARDPIRAEARRQAPRKARLSQKKTAQARLEAAMDPARYGPGGSEVGRHPVDDTIDALMARIRPRVAAERAR